MAATINVLTGTDWGVGGNWSIASTEPIDGGKVALTEKIPGPVTGGLVNDGVYLDMLHVQPACTQTIGTPAAPLTMSAKKMIVEGQAGFNFACEDGGGTDDVQDCRIMCANAGVPVFLDSESANPGDWDQIVVNRGKVTIGGGMQFGTCRLEVGQVTGAGDATVDIATSGAADTLPTILQTSGKITSRVIVTTADVFGGTFEQFDAGITTINVGAGGTFVQKSATQQTITTLRILPGGVADFTQGFGETIITTLWLHPGGLLLGSDQTGGTLEGALIVTNPKYLGGTWKRTANS